MRRASSPTRASGLPPSTPTLEAGVMGPRKQVGFLLRASHSEALQWDVEHEIISTGRLWMEDRGGWWIAARYLDTVVDVVLRTAPAVLVLDPAGGDRLLRREGGVVRQEPL